MDKITAKRIWKNIYQELLDGQRNVDHRFNYARSEQNFREFITNNQHSLNIIQSTYLNYKCGHYGKILVTRLVFPENDRLYLETSFYPLSKNVFPTKLRISMSDKFVYSKHFMERLIERKNFTTSKAVKKYIKQSFGELSAATLIRGIGAVDVSTAFIIVQGDTVSYGDLEINEETGTAVLKTIVSANELYPNQLEIIKFILSETGLKTCLLLAHELPQTKNEASNLIIDTPKFTDDTDFRKVLDVFSKNVSKQNRKPDNKVIKGLVSTLQLYDPTSPEFLSKPQIY